MLREEVKDFGCHTESNEQKISEENEDRNTACQQSYQERRTAILGTHLGIRRETEWSAIETPPGASVDLGDERVPGFASLPCLRFCS